MGRVVARTWPRPCSDGLCFAVLPFLLRRVQDALSQRYLVFLGAFLWVEEHLRL